MSRFSRRSNVNATHCQAIQWPSGYFSCAVIDRLQCCTITFSSKAAEQTKMPSHSSSVCETDLFLALFCFIIATLPFDLPILAFRSTYTRFSDHLRIASYRSPCSCHLRWIDIPLPFPPSHYRSHPIPCFFYNKGWCFIRRS